MKKKSIFLAIRLLMAFFVVLTPFNAWADIDFLTVGDGSSENPYQISSADDWNNLAEYVAAGNNCSELFFKMTNDIGTESEPITKALGKQIGPNASDRKRFKGTFDGGNHTLYVNISSVDSWFENNPNYCAPFAYTWDATIKDLRVDGYITATGQFASGLVGSTGDGNKGTCTINHCEVAVAITANYKSTGSKYCNHGGFIGIAEGSATITDSWFSGKFLGEDYSYSGGFIGMNKGSSTKLENCLFNPSKITIKDNKIQGSCEFVHTMSNVANASHTLIKAYWVSHFGDPENAQGQRVYTSEPDGNAFYYSSVQAADGHIYYVITGSKTWSAIQTQMNDAGTDSYTLSQDVVAGSNDVALVVPANKTFTLNLDGNTLDRGLGLESAQANGYVIKVESGATLTINGAGIITGGNNTSDCGGIYNEGTLIIDNVIIKDNYTEGDGGGIYNAGELTLIDATITENVSKTKDKNGAGVSVADNSTFNVQGNVQIKENYNKYTAPAIVQTLSNVYLDGSSLITITGSLDNSTTIGVGMEGTTGVFTSGLSGYGSTTNFSSDKKLSIKVQNGEAVLYAKLSLANNANNNSTLSNNDGRLADVTLKNRTLYKDGMWNTLCLPFDVTIAGSVLDETDVEVKEFNSSSVDENTLTLTFTDVDPAGTIPAGTPFIIKWVNSNTSLNAPVFSNVTIKNELHPTATTDVDFTGTFSVATISSTDNTKLFLQGNNELYYPNGIDATTIQAFTAYFQLNGDLAAGDTQNPAPIQRTILDFGDGTTAIAVIEDGRVKTNEEISGWYDLSGRKLSGQPSAKGIYIVNGQKVAIK